MRLLRLLSMLAALLVAAPAGLRADDAVPVIPRIGTHPDFGRVVFDFPAQVRYRLSRDGDRVRLSFEAAAPIASAASRPRNVLALAGGAGQAQLVVAPGTKLRVWRLGNSIVLDVLDPDPAPAAEAPGALSGPPAPPPATQSATPAPPATPVAPVLSPAPSGPAPPPPPAPGPAPPPAAPAPVPAIRTEAAQASPEPASGLADAAALPAGGPDLLAVPPAAAGPLALSAHLLPPPAGEAGALAEFPFDASTGLAILRRGGEILLVFDERRPIDLSDLQQEPVFRAASVQLLAAATVIHLAAPADLSLAIGRAREGWTVRATGGGGPAHAIAPVLKDKALLLPASAPGRVVSLPDPAGGGMLLVGTMREPGEAMVAARRTGLFALLPTLQGVAVEPLADTLFLRPGDGGFRLGAEPDGLPLAEPPPGTDDFARAAALTRRFDFPPWGARALAARLSAELDAAAAAPPLGRARPQREAAQTLLALGLANEAGGMLALAAEQDGREAADPNAVGLRAIAATLAGRLDEADGLADPRLDGTDEVTLWRAVRTASAEEGSPAAAAAFAAAWPLVLSYPTGLRSRLLPLLAETLALNRAEGARRLLAARKDDKALRLARGFLLEADGDTGAALAAYDALATDPDRLTRSRAAVRAIALRLAKGQIDQAVAADGLERQSYAWRGDDRELALRLRAAELRAEAGAWRPALSALRDTAAFFPDRREMVEARLRATFAALLSDHRIDGLAPIDLVALVGENPDLLPGGEEGAAIGARLADRLLALDLPKRADPVLEKLLGATSGAARAALGTRLAALRLDEGDGGGALAALDASEADGLAPPEAGRRAVLRAQASAFVGLPDGAVSQLAAVGGADADAARAAILERQKRWPEAAAALADLARQTLPADGPLDAGEQQLVLRLAAALAEAGDRAGLDALRAAQVGRLGAGPVADMFRLLTDGPVASAGDIGRLGGEIALARGLTEDIRAIQPSRSARATTP